MVHADENAHEAGEVHVVLSALAHILLWWSRVGSNHPERIGMHIYILLADGQHAGHIKTIVSGTVSFTCTTKHGRSVSAQTLKGKKVRH